MSNSLNSITIKRFWSVLMVHVSVYEGYSPMNDFELRSALGISQTVAEDLQIGPSEINEVCYDKVKVYVYSSCDDSGQTIR